MKTKIELNTIKEKAETENRQRRLLTDEEAEQVTGGVTPDPVTEKPELELDDASEDGMKSKEELDEIDKAIDPLSEIMQILV